MRETESIENERNSNDRVSEKLETNLVPCTLWNVEGRRVEIVINFLMGFMLLL